MRAVGELKGGVTGALIEPPGMYRWWGSLDEADGELDDRFLSQGIRELASAALFTLAAY